MASTKLILDQSQRSIAKSIEKLSDGLNGKTWKDYASCQLTLNNEFGRGTIRSFDLHPGLAAVIYDITFHKDIELELKGMFLNPLYFIFCVEGELKHRFSNESELIDINSYQNCIMTSKKGVSNIFNLSAGEKYTWSMIYAFRRVESTDGQVKYLRDGLSDILEDVKNLDSYRYLGEIRPITGNLVDVLIHHNKKGVVGRLLTESLILRIMSKQLENRDEKLNSPKLNSPLRKKETKRILKLSKILSDKLEKSYKIEEMSGMTGLNPAKLQAGFKYLFDMSVNTYQKNLRLDAALDQILNTDKTISEIVYSVGLSSRSYFSKIFRDRYGKSPTEYRDSIQGSKSA